MPADDPTTASPSPTPIEELQALIYGGLGTQLVYVAARLGIVDMLADGPRASAEVAARAGAHPVALHRVMRALARVGVLEEQADGRFALTPVGELLRAGRPGSQRAAALGWGEEYWPAFGALLHAVQTNETPFEHVHGLDLFAYFARNPSASAQFNDRMAARARAEIAAVLAVHDFSGARRIVDVAGGVGVGLSAILCRYPDARGILFDLPAVVASAPATLGAAGVAERCEIVGGDVFRDDLPQGDVYVLSRFIHDWDDEPAGAILRRVRSAMPAGATVLLLESVLPQRVVRPPGSALRLDPVLFDLTMMVVSGGRERTEEEHRALMAGARLRLVRVVPTGTPDGLCVVEGVAADAD
jgi:hypothetical protein